MSQFIEMFSNKTWKDVYLEDVVSEDCSLSYGIVQPGDSVDDGIPIVRPVDLIDNVVEPDNLKRTTIDIANSYKRTVLKGGELLLCVRGTTGILSMASTRLNGSNVTRGIVPIWFKKNISKAFMFHQIKSDYVQNQIKEKTYGTTLLQINIKDLRKIKVILPPEDLQQKFVSIAEQADKSGFDGRKSQFIEMFDFHELNLNSPSKDFESMCFDDTSSATKIPAGDYLQVGKYVIYDQAQEKDVAGYSNTEQGLCRKYPAILFGDHSRVVKYINEPFFIGADGVKIIRPKEDNLIPEFLYYDLKYHTIPNTGYNRHFKYIKMIRLTKASLEEQSRFLSIAHQADKSGSVLQYRIAC